MYRRYPALYATDYDPKGFSWINADDADRSIYSFVRRAPTGKKNLLFVLNMTPIERDDYRCGVPKKASYKLILNSMDPKYGGNYVPQKIMYSSVKGECDHQPYSIAYPLPPYGCAVFEW